MKKNKKFDAVLEWFRANRPVAESELRFRNPYELLVCVMLSAQCTDKRVNLVTPALFGPSGYRGGNRQGSRRIARTPWRRDL